MPLPIATATTASVSAHSLGYAQARIHARISAWPSERDWMTLNPLNNYSHYLEDARKTSLGTWLRGVRPDDDVHGVEAAIRVYMLEEVAAVARWSPTPAKPAVQWFRFVPYLPHLAHLVRSGTSLPWMRTDAFLEPFLTPEGELRPEAMSGEPGATLFAEGDTRSLNARWMDELRTRLPKSAQSEAAGTYKRLLRTMRTILEMHPAQVDERGQPLDSQIHDRLMHMVHMNVTNPVVLLAYLALVTWNLTRLQAELVSRRVFEAREGFT